MNLSLFKTRVVFYVVFLVLLGYFFFNFLLAQQSSIMYRYFIEKPTAYNLERAERLSASIYQSFKTEVGDPSLDNVRMFIKKYNEIPFLSVNFIYKDPGGEIKSVLDNVGEVDVLNAEYVFPITQGSALIGTLLVYNINKDYKKGLAEYRHMMDIARVFFAVILLLFLSILIYREYSTRIDQEKRLAEYQAVHDGLTGLFTHQYFKKHLETEIRRSERYKRPISLIMCDIDHFKNFNDKYGHLAGDNILKAVAGIFSENTRSSDIVARYGGEELAILLLGSGTNNGDSGKKTPLNALAEETLDAARRIKTKIEHARFGAADKENSKVTVSMGISFYDGRADYKPDYLISEADVALYRSKNNGRNLITVYTPDSKKFSQIS